MVPTLEHRAHRARGDHLELGGVACPLVHRPGHIGGESVVVVVSGSGAERFSTG